MRAAVINAPTKVGAGAWRTCWTRTRTHGSMFAVNETFTRRAKALYAVLATAAAYGTYGLWGSPNPVFWNRRTWRRVDGRIVQLHQQLSRAAEWPGFNGARSATVAVLRRRGRKRSHLPQVALIATHWVPGGPKVDESDRRDARDVSRRAIRDLIVEHLDAGRVVIVMGDFNLEDPVDFAVRGFRWVRGVGVDKVGVAVPDGYRLTSSDFELYDAPTDHRHGVAARFRWELAA